jgi:hypothetical protein
MEVTDKTLTTEQMLAEALREVAHGIKLAYEAASRGCVDEAMIHCGHHEAKALRTLAAYDSQPRTVLEPLTPKELLGCVRDAALVGCNLLKLTRDVGPYEITEPTHALSEVALKIQSALAAKNGIGLADRGQG